MNDTNTTNTPGCHFGELPQDPEIVADIERMNARGWDTTTTATYEAMRTAGIEPDVWRLAA